MFTGIIETTARVIGVAKGPAFQRLTIVNPFDDVRDGESVAINGVCLTVAERGKGEIGFDVIAETLGRTNLGLLTEKDSVHVERSLRLGDRLSGHFVQGHVDGTARLIRDGAEDTGERRLTLECADDVAEYLTPKGSIALDGVSLTLAAVRERHFEVALIPTTLQITLLSRRPIGWPFNLETDVLSKTVVAWLRRHGPK